MLIKIDGIIEKISLKSLIPLGRCNLNNSFMLNELKFIALKHDLIIYYFFLNKCLILTRRIMIFCSLLYLE
jgi:hypothetical protein